MNNISVMIEPDWASVSLGIYVCTACSAVHRSLGTHISKIRSLKLDHWDEQGCTIMAALGNERGNKLWEATKPSNITLTPDSNR